jgi:hypothetical protein
MLPVFIVVVIIGGYLFYHDSWQKVSII